MSITVLKASDHYFIKSNILRIEIKFFSNNLTFFKFACYN